MLRSGTPAGPPISRREDQIRRSWFIDTSRELVKLDTKSREIAREFPSFEPRATQLDRERPITAGTGPCRPSGRQCNLLGRMRDRPTRVAREDPGRRSFHRPSCVQPRCAHPCHRRSYSTALRRRRTLPSVPRRPGRSPPDTIRAWPDNGICVDHRRSQLRETGTIVPSWIGLPVRGGRQAVALLAPE